jgi:hypothetical protein
MGQQPFPKNDWSMKMVNTIITASSGIDDVTRHEMFKLFSRYFSNTRFSTFTSDLDEKDLVIMLSDRQSGTVVGFSTASITERIVNGRKVLELFSGDTIVEQTSWKYNGLSGPFGHVMLYCIEKYTGLPVYWLLITKGYRTYRFLPVYFQTFYPNYKTKTPAREQEIIDTLATSRFGEYYSPVTGLVSFSGTRDYLAGEFADLPEKRLSNPHIRFFAEKNPGFTRGDELVCIAEVGTANLRKSARRVIDSCSVEWRL